MASVLLFLSSFGLICVLYVLWYVVKHVMMVWKIKKALNQIPSAKMHWLYGHLHLVKLRGEKYLEAMRECIAERPRMESFWLGNWMVGVVRVWHPDTVKIILKSPEPKYMLVKFLKVVFGDGLLLSSGAKWARNRAMLTPAFHVSVLKQYVAVKDERAKVLREKLLEYADTDKSVDMHRYMSLMSAEVLMRCVFSNNVDLQSTSKFDPFMKVISSLEELWIARMARPWLYPDWIYNLTSEGRQNKRCAKLVHTHTEKLIAERKKMIGNLDEAKSLLDILLCFKDEEGNGLTDEEIRDEAGVFIFAGYNTVTKSLSWLTYALASNPEAQEKCQQEVDDFYAAKNEDCIKHEDLGKFPYLTMCIKEAMRLYTTIPNLSRELMNPLTIDGVLLPPHTIVTVNTAALHLNPQIWTEPMKFKPERFLRENMEKMHPYAYLPFGGGLRNCIGKNFGMNEMKIAMVNLLKKVTLKVDVDRVPVRKISVVTKSENGFYLKIESRI